MPAVVQMRGLLYGSGGPTLGARLTVNAPTSKVDGPTEAAHGGSPSPGIVRVSWWRLLVTSAETTECDRLNLHKLCWVER